MDFTSSLLFSLRGIPFWENVVLHENFYFRFQIAGEQFIYFIIYLLNIQNDSFYFRKTHSFDSGVWFPSPSKIFRFFLACILPYTSNNRHDVAPLTSHVSYAFKEVVLVQLNRSLLSLQHLQFIPYLRAFQHLQLSFFYICIGGQANTILKKHKKSHYFGLGYFYFSTKYTAGSKTFEIQFMQIRHCNSTGVHACLYCFDERALSSLTNKDIFILFLCPAGIIMRYYIVNLSFVLFLSYQ